MSTSYGVSNAAWRKSTYSNGEGGACVEVADGFSGVMPVRDSKSPEGPAVMFPAEGWRSFLSAVKDGTFN